MNILPNKKVLESLIQSKPGEICYVEDEKKYYLLTESGWSPINVESDGEGINMSLYELNKNIISQLPAISKEAMNIAIEVINNYRMDTDNKYYALICRECGYYTMFNTKEVGGELPDLSTGIIECLANVGEIITINLDENGGAIEIWVRARDDVFYFILFGYDQGVVTIER